MIAPVRIELPTVFGMGSVNAFLFVEPEPLLIDCGEKTPQSWETLKLAFNEHGLDIKDLKKLIITHAHVDHMGMAGKIAEETDAEIWVNEETLPWAINLEHKWDERANLMKGQIDRILPPSGPERDAVMNIFSMFGTIRQVWDPVPEDRVNVFPMSGQMDLGGKAWEILYAPGHAQTQTCFYQPEDKAFLSADMILRKTPTPVFEVHPDHPTERLKTLPIMLKSFEMVRALDIEHTYPGHYDNMGDPTMLIDNQVARIHQRKEEVAQHIESGTNDFFNLFKIMYPGPMHLPGFAMLLGYLDLLELEGRVTIQSVGQKPVVELV